MSMIFFEWGLDNSIHQEKSPFIWPDFSIRANGKHKYFNLYIFDFWHLGRNTKDHKTKGKNIFTSYVINATLIVDTCSWMPNDSFLAYVYFWTPVRKYSQHNICISWSLTSLIDSLAQPTQIQRSFFYGSWLWYPMNSCMTSSSIHNWDTEPYRKHPPFFLSSPTLLSVYIIHNLPDAQCACTEGIAGRHNVEFNCL